MDEVIVLSAPEQRPPAFGERLRLELRRARQGARVRSGVAAAQLAQRAACEGEDFLLAVEAPGVPADKAGREEDPT